MGTDPLICLFASGARAQSAPDDEPIEEVEVVGKSAGEVLTNSAQAVHVVETEEAARQSADLAEVMAREQGVSVRRSGGLGSDTAISLNGFTGEQIRFYLDELPLNLAGFPLGLGAIPLGAVERVEVYRGVVPIRFGGDALGGAVNVVSPPIGPGLGGSLSFQGGSFDTYRSVGELHFADPDLGVRVRATGFLDAAANDYTVDVEVPDAQGRLSPATVRRFHDRYDALGGTVEVGAYNRRWAEALTARVYRNTVRQELQTNITMTEPYGEPVSDVGTTGAAVSYQHHPVAKVSLRSAVGYAWNHTAFEDLGECVYDWFGQCVYPRERPGEVSVNGTDLELFDRDAVGRLSVEYAANEHHAVSASVAPTWFTRTGVDHLNEPGTPDPERNVRAAGTLVTGAEHRLRAVDDALENLLFTKVYAQRVDAKEEEQFGGGIAEERRTTVTPGFGDGARLNVGDHVRVKASYEWATRLPSPDEQFGDGVRHLSNLELVPERSHNANLGVRVAAEGTPAGTASIEVEGFVRQARDLILTLGTDTYTRNHNAFSATAKGAEGAARWTSPGEWVSVGANGTFLDFRNTSTEGTFRDFAGDRIPNRPWLFANTSAQLGVSDVAGAGDRLTLDWYVRYVHPFFRGWESVGIEEYKQQIPAQTTHTLVQTYVVAAGEREVSASVEVDNLTNAKVYDWFGVQRAGRAVFGKVGVAF